VWVNDSVISPRIEPLTMLAAVASVTERVTLGTATLLPVLRRPVLAAQALASLDLLSGGRLVVAVGAGFPGRFGRPLHTLSEVPWPRRFARLNDTVALWRQLWGIEGQDHSAFHGEVLHFDELPRGTTPCQTGGPPIWLGGATPQVYIAAGARHIVCRIGALGLEAHQDQAEQIVDIPLSAVHGRAAYGKDGRAELVYAENQR
jgi:alkanesulfonate monooxygenase SsuD/methylene tetrahydromethanopterin reductase-like flavin-dependent oxidoreductase (luciferase family)